MIPINKNSRAYREGLAARRGGDLEPRAPYDAESQAYREYAAGYMFDPFPDRLPPLAAMRTRALTNSAGGEV